MLTKKQRIEKAVHIINEALHRIEESAADAAYMSEHAARFASCYTMQELDRVQKECDKQRIKSNVLSKLYHDMRDYSESVKVLDFAALYLWYPWIRAAAMRHAEAHAKKHGEPLDFFALYEWLYTRIPADYWTGAAEIRRDYKSAFVTLTVKKGA